MAKSTSHPDCVHCRFMVRHQNGEYRCRQHNMILHTPVSLFCKTIAAPEQKDADYQLWFKETIDAESLDANTLYTWVETPTRDAEGSQQIQIDAEVIAPLTTYINLSAGIFWRMLRDLRHKRRSYYKKQGYDIDDGKS